MAKNKNVTVNFKGIEKDVKRFRKIAVARMVTSYKREILKSIAGGRSPVKGFGRFKKYSVGYRQQIKGNAFLGKNGEWFIFRVINGVKVPIEVEDKKIPIPKHLKGKKVSPVNLRASGKMLSSFSVIPVVTPKFSKLIISFDNELADIHNRQGAGKSKVVRRMLPTKVGETFSKSINLRVRRILTQIAKNIFKG